MQITSFLPCDDIEASRRFYAGIGVSMDPRRGRPWPPSRAGATLLSLTGRDGIPPDLAGRLVFLVDDVQAVLASVPRLGGSVLATGRPPGRIAIVTDPAGTMLGITDVPH